MENRLDGLTFAIQDALTALAILKRRIETITALKQEATTPNAPGATPMLRAGLNHAHANGNKTA